MRKILILLIILVLIIGGVVIAFKKNNYQNLPIQSSYPTSTASNNNCTLNQLKTDVTAEGAAGNIFAKLVVTNISENPCNITLGNTVTSEYSATNISVNYNDKTAANMDYMLSPNASVYSQVHFPNGPQCSEVSEQNISISYKDSKFMDPDGKDYLTVQACKNSSEQTVIDIWPLSQNPITP